MIYLPIIAPLRQPFAVSTTSSMNSASMPDLRNVTIASVGVQTIGSLSLNDVLMTRGTPVLRIETRDQLVKARIGLAAHELHPRGSVLVHHGGDAIAPLRA